MSSDAAPWVNTSEKIERLRALWNARTADGKAEHSASEIATAMGTTKNAIVGWIRRAAERDRSGWLPREAPTWKGKRADPSKPKPPPSRRPLEGKTLPPLASVALPSPQDAPRPQPKPIVRARPTSIVVAEEAKPAPVDLAPVLGDEDCAWLSGNGTRDSPWVQCTNKAVLRRPYCPRCAERVYVKVRDRREDVGGDRLGA